MKNLKKVLSLVLALAMALSLMTVAFAADAKDFADYDKVSNNEAMDVMVALGVFEGSDGNLNPTGELTREQAAKIITYMLLGKDAADKLVATTAPYADVAATRWSAGSIAYCTEQGIIAGSNGKFDPTGKLTGQQFAKMLLCALGYDAKQEGLVGGAWAINASSLAVKAGLDENLSTLSTVMTREQAAQMAFNAEKATLVDYTGGTDITTSDGTSIKVDANRYNVGSAAEAAENGYADVATPYTQFCEQYAKNLKLDKRGHDNFGRSSNKWSYKGVKVGTYASSATITYTAETKDSVVKADLKDYNNYNKTSASAANLWVDGKKTADTNTSAAEIAKLTGNGVKVEIFTSNNAITDIVVINTYFAEVTKVDKKAEEITLKVLASAGNSEITNLKTTKGYGTFAQDDYVLLTISDADAVDANSTVESIAAPEKVTGVATNKNTKADTITLAGTAYTAAKKIVTANNVSKFTVSAKYDATLYLDANGYIAFAKAGAAATSDKAVAVLKKYQSLNKDGQIVDMIKGVTSNGETVEWEAAADSYDANKVYTYTENDGKYTLEEANQTNLSTAQGDKKLVYKHALTKSIAKTDKTLCTGVYYASDVKFIFVNGGKATVMDGVQKVAKASSGNTYVYATLKEVDNVWYATAVYAITSAPSSAASTGDVVYVGAETGDYSAIDSETNKVKDFKTYDAYINGEKVDNFYAASGADAGFYYVKKDSKTGAYVLDDAYNATSGKLAVVTGKEVSAYASNILTADSKDYGVANATIIDTKSADGDLYDTLDEIKDALATKKVTVAVMYDADTMNASYVFVSNVVDK